MANVLEAIFSRRAIKVFDPVEISPATREQILNAARVAPSSFNIQPYRFYWIESPERRNHAARLCMGQVPAETASALAALSSMNTARCGSMPQRSINSW